MYNDVSSGAGTPGRDAGGREWRAPLTRRRVPRRGNKRTERRKKNKNDDKTERNDCGRDERKTYENNGIDKTPTESRLDRELLLFAVRPSLSRFVRFFFSAFSRTRLFFFFYGPLRRAETITRPFYVLFFFVFFFHFSIPHVFAEQSTI